MELFGIILICLVYIAGNIVGGFFSKNSIHCDPEIDDLERVLMFHHYEDGEFNYESCAYELRGIFKHSCNPIRYRHDCLKQKCGALYARKGK